MSHFDPYATLAALFGCVRKADAARSRDAMLPYGPTYIGDFKSEVEAQNWIIRKAKDHFPRRKRHVLESC
jgi:hypothetical protein